MEGVGKGLRLPALTAELSSGLALAVLDSASNEAGQIVAALLVSVSIGAKRLQKFQVVLYFRKSSAGAIPQMTPNCPPVTMHTFGVEASTKEVFRAPRAAHAHARRN